MISESFKVYQENDNHLDKNLEPFLISTARGFLPRTDPILKLPKKFDALNDILEKMRWNQPDGSQGLLAKNQLGEAVKKDFPLLEVKDINDKMLALALFRDYSFLTSAYLLEECHHNYLKSGSYGLGRDLLPKNIARPFCELAEMLELKPFMEYNTCYALNNYYRIDPKGDLSIDNVDIYRSFVNMRSENGFINVHVTINQYGGQLIRTGMDVLRSCEMRDRAMFNESLKAMRDVMIFMNNEFERMYIESNPSDYNIFRTFIMGITNQPMFPNGVVYEGCYENKPQFFRGESGANDSIIPFCDNILEITKFMPNNALTQILRDFRTYRPKVHQEFLTFTEETANKVGVIEFAKEDPESLICLLEVVDQDRAFRQRHWILTNMYIISKSKHPVATGGSPITTWLSNQLLVVINFIKSNAYSLIDKKVKLSSAMDFKIHAMVKRCEAEEKIILAETEKKRAKYNQ
jgi:indoleamine 2,3-dioxygenase